MDMEKVSVEALVDQENMDAKLFVQLGNHLGSHFFDRLHVIVFGNGQEITPEVISQQ